MPQSKQLCLKQSSFLTRDTHCAKDLARERPHLPLSILSTFPIHVSWEPDQSYPVKCKLELVGTKSVLSYGTVALSLPLVAHRWNCHTSNFDSCCDYSSTQGRIQGRGGGGAW